MSPEDWQEIDALVQAAFEQAPEERAAFLAEACAGRPELRREVTALLEADRRAESFLETSPLETSPFEPAASRRPAPGSRLGPYLLLEEIGYGGWSRVFRAVRDDEAYRQEVAVKVVDPGLEWGLGDDTGGDVGRRFRVERQILAGLVHPSIARLLDGGQEDGRPYFVLELVDGRPIDRYCAEARLDVEDRLRLLVRVCDAVAYAHQRLIVHRDLKPGNLLVSRDGAPKLLDFGIAKVLEPAALPYAVEATRSGLRPMTPAWAAPEQVRGEAVTTATDVYALGLLLYLLLTGERAYSLDELSPAEVERTVCELDPPPPSRRLETSDEPPTLAPPGATPQRLRGDLDAVVLKALAKDPDRRYRTVDELRQDLERHLAGEPIEARPATRLYRAGKWLRRHRWAAAAATAALVVCAAFVAALARQATHLAAERDEARRQFERAEEVTDFLVETFAEADPGRTQGRDVAVRSVLKRGLARIDRLDGEPESQARLLATLGDVHAALGDVDQGLELLRRARLLEVSRRGPDHLRVASLDHRLGEILLAADRFVPAEEAVRRALELRRRTLGEEHPETATSRGLLGRLRYLQGYWTEAATLLEEAIARLEGAGASNSEARLDLLGDLAWAEGRHDREGRSRILLQQRLEGARLELGAAHPLVADTLRRMIWFEKDPDRRKALREEALRLHGEIFDPDHPKMASLFHAVASSVLAEDPARARELGERALEIDRRVWGDGAWSLSLDHSVIAAASQRLGELDGAEEHWRLAVSNARRGTPATHPWRVRVLTNWVGFLLRAGKADEASKALREIHDLRRGLPHRDESLDPLFAALLAVAELEANGENAGDAAERLRRHGPEALQVVAEGSTFGVLLARALEEL